MKHSNLNLFTIVLLFIVYCSLIIVIGCTGNKSQTQQNNDSSQLKGTISISGAFALYPIAVKWAEEFKKLHPDVKLMCLLEVQVKELLMHYQEWLI